MPTVIFDKLILRDLGRVMGMKLLKAIEFVSMRHFPQDLEIDVTSKSLSFSKSQCNYQIQLLQPVASLGT